MTTSTPRWPSLSLGEGVGLLFKLVVLFPPKLLIGVLRCYTLATLRGISLQYFAKCTFCRVALHNLTPRQLQFMQPSTLATYTAWLTRRQSRAAAKSQRDGADREAAFLASRLKVDVEPLPDGRSSLLWIGDRHRASKFVLFFHGGGYVAPAMPGHLEWCARAYLLASPAAAAGSDGQGEEVAVAVLQYTLCPDAVYPTQLQQAADALRHLFASGRVRPGNLVIGGDSAGGNLAAQVLVHLLRPHPAAKEIVLEGRLAGAFLVSPWVSGRVDWASMERNRGIDMITGELRKWALEGTDYKAEVKAGKGWLMPMDSEDPEGWLRGVDKFVERVYVTAGVQEVLLDQDVAFAEAVRKGNPGLTMQLEVSKDEAHDWILLEGEKGVDGDATRRMRTWFKGVFWPSSGE